MASVFLEFDFVSEGIDLEAVVVVFSLVVLGDGLEMLFVVAGIKELLVIVALKILVELEWSLGRSLLNLHN